MRVVMMSNFYGMYLGDPDLFPIFEALNKLNVTIFEHPTTPCTEYNHLKYDITAEAPTITQKQWQSLNRPVSTRQFAAPTLDFLSTLLALLQTYSTPKYQPDFHASNGSLPMRAAASPPLWIG